MGGPDDLLLLPPQAFNWVMGFEAGEQASNLDEVEVSLLITFV